MTLTRRQTRILLAAAAWTIYVWGFRTINLVGDDERDFAFKAVHIVLAMVSVAFAVAIGRIGLAARRRAKESDGYNSDKVDEPARR